MWDLFGHLEWDPTRRAGFLGGDEYNYSAPLAPVMEEDDEEEEEDAIVGGDEISGEEERDDTEDYLGYLAYHVEKGKAEGKVDELPLMPEGLDEEEVMRLALKASQE
jgi:hypothetical protein